MNPLVVISLDGIRAIDVQNPSLRIPHIRRVMSAGATIDKLTTIFPSVTWAIHNAVITGCHPAKTGILGNSVYDRIEAKRVSLFDPSAADFDRDQKRPHLFGALSQSGVAVAAVCWPMTQGAQAIRYNIPELYQQADFDRVSTPDLWDELKRAGLPVDRYGEWSADHAKNPLQDSLTADIAIRLVTGQKPGALFLHFLLVDSYQHDFGVGSPEAFWALEYIDSLVGRVLSAIEADQGLEKTNVILFSDHGHASSLSAFYIDSWLEEQGFGGQPGKGPYVAASNGGVGYLYNLGATPVEATHLVESLKALEWVNAVWTRDEFRALGLPINDPTGQGRLPDVIFETRLDHYVMTGEGPGITVGPCAYKSMHGYRPEHPEMESFLTASGPAFVPGARVQRGSILDLAAMVNRIYDLGLEGMDGRIPDGLLVD